ncbi:MAG: hypothetical protein IJ122_06440 [Methanobrevibacter sp.]|nr:hypothetical protein [Methanobrevibacter sp.]
MFGKKTTKNLDLVYYFEGQDSEELRYSIRSACENLNVRKIFLVGDKPKWFKETENSVYVHSKINIGTNGLGSIPILHLANLLKSGKCPDEFLLMNDDFFILKRIKTWVNYYRDEKDYEEKARKNHSFHLRTFRSLTFVNNLDGHKYNLHSPIKIEKKNLIELIKIWSTLPKRDIDFRTFYGNLYIKDAIPIKDNKITTDDFQLTVFVSTNNDSFKNLKIGRILRTKFNKPSFVEMVK